MLLLLEKLAEPIRKIDSEAAAQNVLRILATTFGFSKAFVVEYSPDLKTVAHLIDTDAERLIRLTAYFDKFGLSRNIDELRRLHNDGRGVRVDASRLKPGEPFIPFLRQNELVEGYKIPITQQGDVAGQFFFSGDVVLDERAETALLLLSYSLFSQVRSLRVYSVERQPKRLTPRETEIMGLSATGMTSVQIARQLDISARTVNQHVDNVVAKLGTRNRAHTIAELIRRDMLQFAAHP